MATVTRGKTWQSGDVLDVNTMNDAALPSVSIDNSEVTTAKIADGAVTSSKLASTVDFVGKTVTLPAAAIVGETQIASGAVTTSKVAASVITGQTALADPLASGDQFLVHDTSASALRRVPWSSMYLSGAPLQMVQAVKTDRQTIAGASGWTDVSGLSLTLTRAIASASGRIRIQASISSASNNGSNAPAFRVLRDGVAIALGDADGATTRATAQGGGSNNSMNAVSIDFIDTTPGTGSTVTYKIQAAVQSTVTAYINRPESTTNSSDGFYRGISTLTLTELAP